MGARVRIDVTEGHCYKIRVADYHGLPGASSLSVYPWASPRCQSGQVTWTDPPEGVRDARRPHQPGDKHTSEGTDRVVVAAPIGGHPRCWTFCETNQNPHLRPPYSPELETNRIAGIETSGDGTYVLLLKRAIAPGEMTAITYRDDNGGVVIGRFVAQPGDVNADGTADVRDIDVMIDIIRGTFEPPWGLFSADIDRDGTIAAPDLLELIDLLTGTGAYEPWLGSIVPGDSATCPE